MSHVPSTGVFLATKKFVLKNLARLLMIIAVQEITRQEYIRC